MNKQLPHSGFRIRRRVPVFIVLSILIVGCHNKDETEFEKRIVKLEKRVHRLEKEIGQSPKNDGAPLPQIEQKIDTLINTVQTLKNNTPTSEPTPIPVQEPDTAQLISSQSPSKNGSSVSIGLSKTDAKRILEQSKPKVQRCGFQPGSAITFNIRVASTGRVSEVQPHRPHMDTALGNCAAKIVYGVPFTRTSKDTAFSHTFTF